MGASYSLDKHGNFKQDLYDSYLSSTDGRLASLKGKVVAITGTTTGSLGYYVAKTAVAKEAKLVLLLNRPSDRSIQTEADVKEGALEGTTVQTLPIDLLSLDSVKKAAVELNEISKANGGLDVLCCNAGIMARNDDRSDDGFDVQMQANQLSHYLLTRLCMDSLEQAAASHGEARAVFHSSSARYGKELEARFFEQCEVGTLGGNDASDFGQFFLGKEGSWLRYHQTKLANSAFAMALHDELEGKGSKVKALACDPGWAHSNLQVSAVSTGTMSNFLAKLGSSIAQSAPDGSLPCSLACFSPEANSGDFYMPSKMGGMNGEPIRSILGGEPVKTNTEKETTSAKNKTIVMDACKKIFNM